MIIFSRIKAKAETGETHESLVAGIPYGLTDLEGWKNFELFLSCLEDTHVEVRVETFGYGEGDACKATVEEVAYMYKRLEMNKTFLESRCEKLGEHSFNFDWMPSELFN